MIFGNYSFFEVFAVFIVIFLILCETNHTVRYWAKQSLLFIWVMLTATILTPYFAFRPFQLRNFVLSSYFIQPVSPVIGLKWDIRGNKHLEEEKACIIVSNHQSSLDILGMFFLWPIMRKCTVVAKRELFYAWPFGLAAWLCGLIFIDRVHPTKAKQAMNNCAEILIKNKTKLWVFPEGTRRNTNEIHGFKKGAFHVAVNSQLPIVPVVFSSYSSFLDDKNKHFNAGNVIIEALPQVSTVGLTTDDIPDLMDRIRNSMIDVYKSNTKEIHSLNDKKKSKLLINDKSEKLINDELITEKQNTIKQTIKTQ